jgi:hypothetical protein
MKNNNCQFYLATMCLLLCVGGLAQSIPIFPERHGDHLIVAAPELHFISGRAVERLQNGSTVTYAMMLAIVPEHSKKQTMHAKFTVSYDLWEEKYSAVKIQDGLTASRLTAPMAELWCLENMAIPIRSIPERQSFMIRLECAIEEDTAKDNTRNSGTIFADLVEIFGRKKQEVPRRWEISGGPFRLEDLKMR